MPVLGLARVNGAFYSFPDECEAFFGQKLRQLPLKNQYFALFAAE
jgi:hypothetical protein